MITLLGSAKPCKSCVTTQVIGLWTSSGSGYVLCGTLIILHLFIIGSMRFALYWSMQEPVIDCNLKNPYMLGSCSAPTDIQGLCAFSKARRGRLAG